MEKTKNIAPHVMACKRCEGKGRIFTWTRRSSFIRKMSGL